MSIVLSRRGFLASVVGAAAAPFVPAAPAAEAITVGLDFEAVAAPLQPMWAVVTSGDFNWRAIPAATAEEAFRVYFNEPGEEPLPFDEECVARVHCWDGMAVEDIKPVDWIRGGLGACCSRCGGECFADHGGYAFGNDVVCEDCITFADLCAYDSDRAIDALADQIAENGDDFARKWVAKQEAPELVTAEMWGKARRAAA